nr:surface-adhesin E family protein [Variovorax boronicumulans]
MKRLLVALACLAGAARADVLWLTIVGDRTDPNADTIEMNPIAVSRHGASVVMEIRVSRSIVRTSNDGVQFRSYRGEVGFDCVQGTARFLRSQFYAEPLWRVPLQELRYPSDQVRPMEFRLFEPNPRDKVIKAACGR